MIRKLLRKYINTSYTTHIPELVRFNYAMTAGLFLIAGIMLFFLPDNMPMQFAADGSVNYYLPSYIGVWLMPAVILLAQVLLHLQKRINKINTAVLFLVTCFIACFYLKVAFF
jgi:hypothetical protein